jgi:hypothetical protein
VTFYLPEDGWTPFRKGQDLDFGHLDDKNGFEI